MALPATLRHFESARVLVVGDVMLDEYLWGDVERISPEAPVPVVHMRERTHHLGGAANVAANIRALGGECLTVGLVGEDSSADILRSLFRKQRLSTAGLLSAKKMPTIQKVRIIGQRQQLLRVDIEQNECAGGMTEVLTKRCLSAVGKHGSVVLSDYGKGVLTAPLIKSIVETCIAKDVRIVVDPKVEHFALYRDVDLITPNHHEAGRACGIKIVDSKSLQSAGKALLEMTNAKGVLITRGPQGMSLFRRGAKPVHIPTEAREVYDVSGAGDTVVSALALSLASGNDVETSARIANCAAGVVVGKLGTATVSPQELASALRKRGGKR